jgi:hypothetical protein
MNTTEAFRKILLGEPIDQLEDWQHLIGHHGLGSRLYRLLPPEQRAEFLPAHLYVIQRRSIFSRELRELHSLFQSHSIEFVVLKGHLLADRVYPHPEDRPFSDLDLLFAPKDREAVGKILEREYIKMPQKRFAANAHKEDWQKKDFPDLKVEAHFGLGEKFSTSAPWENWEGYLVLSPLEEFLFLLWHGFVQHRMQKLIWFLDLFYLSRNIDFSAVEKRCAELDLQPALKMFLHWLEWLQGVGEGDAYLQRVILGKNENPLHAAQMRAKLNGGWWKLAQYAWQRKFSSDEF